MEVTQVRKKDLKPDLWAGGQTFQYFIYPEGKKYIDRDFDFRISSATIEQSPSHFTRFEGYHRYLVMLDNKLALRRNGREENYEKMQLFAFNSSDVIETYSIGTDFNLMVANKYNTVNSGISTLNEITSGSFCVVFSIEEMQVSVDGTFFHLAPFDVLLIANQDGRAFRISSAGKVIHFFFSIADKGMRTDRPGKEE